MVGFVDQAASLGKERILLQLVLFCADFGFVCSACTTSTIHSRMPVVGSGKASLYAHYHNVRNLGLNFAHIDGLLVCSFDLMDVCYSVTSYIFSVA